MRITAEWLDDAPNAAPEERATLCELRILLGNVCATEHSEAGHTEIINGLIMPAYSLAHGLAADWWTIFGGRDRDYRLYPHRVGYAIPDLRLRFDGAVFEAWSPAFSYANPPVRFWPATPEVSDRLSAEEALAAFIQATVDRLEAEGERETGAQLRWDWVQQSRADPLETAFCEAAGALRLDPYAIDEGAATLIDQASGLFEGEALLEFLGGVGAARGRETLDWVEAVEDRPAYDSRLPRLHGVAEAVAGQTPSRVGERGWELGYRRARAARRELFSGQAARVGGMRDLSARLGSRTFQLAPPVNGLRALRSDRRGTEHVYLRTQGDGEEARPGHLFALARAVGDAVCFPEPGRYPVNDLRDAHRQAAGRAFAAEFLAPIDEVASMREDGRDAVTIAAEFGVSTQVIEHQIENEERIRLACAA